MSVDGSARAERRFFNALVMDFCVVVFSVFLLMVSVGGVFGGVGFVVFVVAGGLGLVFCCDFARLMFRGH